MKIATQTIAEDSKDLGRQVRTLQSNINDTLARVEFDSVMRLSAQFYPEQVPFTLSTVSKNTVFGLIPVYIRNISQDEVVPLYTTMFDWVGEGDGITVRKVEGLIPGHLYEVRFVAYA